MTLFEAMGRHGNRIDVALRTAKAAGNLYAWMRDYGACEHSRRARNP